MRDEVERLRETLARPGLEVVASCHDAISARIVERAGFALTFMSGYAVSTARIGMPDAGLISYAEMVDQGRNICAAVDIPVIGDGDTGFGNALNVQRTVEGYAAAGFACVMIEDQVSPKRCGWADGVEVVPREAAVSRLRAAVDAREAGAEILILGRTDAATVMGFDEGLWRAEAYQDMGCDIVYLEGAESESELARFAQRIAAPKMFVAVEGSNRTMPSRGFLESAGFKLLLWAVTLLNVSVRAMEDAAETMRGGDHPDRIVSFDHLNAISGLDDYYRFG